MSTRSDLLCRIDSVLDEIEQAFVDSSRVALGRSRARMERWFDWMFPLCEETHENLDEGVWPVGYVQAGEGRPRSTGACDPAPDGECRNTDEWGEYPCQGPPKAHLAYNVRVAHYDGDFMVVDFRNLGSYGVRPMKGGADEEHYSYARVEAARDLRRVGERELDHPGTYV